MDGKDTRVYTFSDGKIPLTGNYAFPTLKRIKEARDRIYNREDTRRIVTAVLPVQLSISWDGVRLEEDDNDHTWIEVTPENEEYFTVLDIEDSICRGR